MCRNKILEKLLAIILIFTLTFANFAFTTKAYAASFVETIFGVKDDTQSVFFDANFLVYGQTGKSIVSDVNNKDLYINMNLAVKNKGYLKDGKIQIVGDKNDLNFVVKENIEAKEEKVENDEENIIDYEENSNDDMVNSNEENVEAVVKEDDGLTFEEESNIENDEEKDFNPEEIFDNFIEENVAEIFKENTEATVEELVESEERIEKFEDNILYLNQFSGNANLEINLPIEYKNEEYVNEEKVFSDSKIVFTGVYVNEKGNETQISEEIILNVSWVDERDIDVQAEPTKYITYDNGIILQTAQRIDNTSEENTLPVKETELNIEVPVINGEKPKTITVVANSTKATNGEDIGETNFNMDNWSYDEESNILKIKVENEKKFIQINENEEDFIYEDKIIEDERYYNGSGTDEFLVTYTYENIELEEEKINVTSNITAIMTTIGGIEGNDNENVSISTKEYNYELTGTTGSIVSLNVENKTEEISKAYAYVNYNNPDRYEMEISSKEAINISYKDIVNKIVVTDTESLYMNKDGSSTLNNDLYYKNIAISEENFKNILGEDGEILVKEDTGEEVFKIVDLKNESNENVLKVVDSNNTEILNNTIDENGFTIINFDEKYSKLSFEISKPISDGNLVILKTLAMRNLSISKEALINVDSIVTKSSIIAYYDYVADPVEVGITGITTKLVDTKTNANLVIDRDTLSTIESNDNVGLRLELNNSNETSDVYGHSEFEIVFPESVEEIELVKNEEGKNDASIAYGAGLSITEVEANGRTIRIVLDGKQNDINFINESVFTGTIIDLKANIKLNMLATTKNDVILLNYSNDEATSYEDNGSKQKDVRISAPTGLVAVTRIKNYDETLEEMISVRQGKKEALVPVHSEAREITEEIIIMNNNSNTVNDMCILGRIPFEGNKNIKTDEELGTTINAKMNSLIESSEFNNGEFKIYYSENAEATKDLNDENNGWIENVENLENIKSYLICPVSEDYIMEKGELLKFSYTYIIPENLTHNQFAYGTFAVYYKNNSEVAITNEISVPDAVGITSGQGPELKMTVEKNKDEIKETEEVSMTIKVENIGDVDANNVNLIANTTEDTEIVRYSSSKEEVTSEILKEIYYGKYESEIGVKFIVPILRSKEIVEFQIVVKAGYLGEESAIENDKLVSKQLEFKDVKPSFKLTADNFGTEINAETIFKIISAEISVQEKIVNNIANIERAGTKIHFLITVQNDGKRTFENLIVQKEIPQEFTIYSCDSNYEFDENTRIATFNLDKIEVNSKKQIKLEIVINELDENKNKVVINSKCIAKADNIDTYESNSNVITIAKPVLVINQTSSTDKTYIKEGETVNYTYLVKNEGEVDAYSVNLTEVIPEGLSVKKVQYIINGVETNRNGNITDNVNITTNISPGAELLVNIEAVALALNGAEEKSVTNYALVSSNEVKSFKSNSITHIVESVDSDNTNIKKDDGNGNINPNFNNNINKTYKISGIAWFDVNADGVRGAEEQLLKGITVKLVNNDTGVIKGTTTTDTKGEYNFAGIEKGNYIVVFEYDTVKYSVTTYRKDGVAGNVNSDAFNTQISQNSTVKVAGVTDIIKIENGSIANIDIGLVLMDKFDLKLDKTITKVVVQTQENTTSEEYNNVSLAKAEIAAKRLTGATIYIEYNITVSNVGDIAGYAKKIIDYIPDGMVFNSGLEANKDWYTGSDGKLYSEALANSELKSGESKSIKLVLVRQMTTENTGIINNQAEIYEDYNAFGVKDKNSEPGNKVQSENDLGKADMVIAVKTGEVFIYVSVIITTVLLGFIAGFVIYNKITILKRKWVV